MALTARDNRGGVGVRRVELHVDGRQVRTWGGGAGAQLVVRLPLDRLRRPRRRDPRARPGSEREVPAADGAQGLPGLVRRLGARRSCAGARCRGGPARAATRRPRRRPRPAGCARSRSTSTACACARPSAATGSGARACACAAPASTASRCAPRTAQATSRAPSVCHAPLGPWSEDRPGGRTAHRCAVPLEAGVSPGQASVHEHMGQTEAERALARDPPRRRAQLICRLRRRAGDPGRDRLAVADRPGATARRAARGVREIPLEDHRHARAAPRGAVRPRVPARGRRARALAAAVGRRGARRRAAADLRRPGRRRLRRARRPPSRVGRSSRAARRRSTRWSAGAELSSTTSAAGRAITRSASSRLSSVSRASCAASRSARASATNSSSTKPSRSRSSTARPPGTRAARRSARARGRAPGRSSAASTR